MSREDTMEASQLLPRHSDLEQRKVVTYWSGVFLVVGQQIGSGIFSTPALVNSGAGSVGMSLILWIMAGFMAWSGACIHIPLVQSNSSIVCGTGIRYTCQWGFVCLLALYFWTSSCFHVLLDDDISN